MVFLAFGTSVPTATRHPKEGSCAPPPATNTRDNRYQGLEFFSQGSEKVKAAEVKSFLPEGRSLRTHCQIHLELGACAMTAGGWLIAPEPELTCTYL